MRQVKRACILLQAVNLISWIPATGSAAPLIDSRVGGLALVGPSTDHPASLHYNPAALGLGARHLLRFFWDGTLRLGHGSIQRHSIDPLTGAPSTSPAARTFEEQDLLQLFPHFFLALSSNLGTDSVVFSVAGYTPSTQRISMLNGSEESWFDPAAQGPLRYHVVDFLFYQVFGTVAASYRIADSVTFGASIAISNANLDFAFVRDAALDGGTTRDPGEYASLQDCGASSPCNYESDSAAEAVRINGSSWGLGFSAGLLVRPHASLDLGLGYVSRIVGLTGDDIATRGEAWVRRSRAVMDNIAADGSLLPDRDISGRATVHFAYPDMVHFGATWRTNARLLLNLRFSWINFSAHEQLNIRLTGSEFRREPRTLGRIDYFRGFQDVFGIQLGGGYRLNESVQLQMAMMVETSAVPSEAVTPLSFDGHKLDGLVALLWQISGSLYLRAGYGLVWTPQVEVDSSVFSPAARVTCADSLYDVDMRECKETERGRGLPTAAGSYSLFFHRLGLSLAYHVD